MSSIPPKMSAPMEGPSAPRGKPNPTTIVLAVLGGIGATCCIGGGIMFALFAPRLREIRESTRTTICESNLRLIGMSIHMYAEDHDERLPNSERWMDQIQRYGVNNRQFRCPEARTRNRENFGYAFNSALGGKKLSAMEKSTPLVFDSILMGRNANSGLESLPNPGRHLLKTMHANNVVLLDGSLMSESSTRTPDKKR